MKRMIAVIMAADIAGYSKLVAEDEEETLRRLSSYRAVFEDLMSRFSGLSIPPPTPFSPNFRARSKRCVAPSMCRRACAPANSAIR
jgi:class 3 adenylate cyclase